MGLVPWDFPNSTGVKAPSARVRYFFKETPPPEGRPTDPFNLYTRRRSSRKEPRERMRRIASKYGRSRQDAR
ncbi:hypothetical protein GCM10029978_001200 [Actinoallomurus acanthiterrae]